MTHLNRTPPILLSICIPTFNRQDVLAHTLDVLRWTLDTGLAIEIIVSDNASEDETERIANEKGKIFPHFRYVRQRVNLGPEKNSISVQRLARGKFFVRLSDDDSLVPEVLLAEVEYLDKNDDIVVSYAPHQVWNDVTKEDHGLFYRLAEPVEFGKSQSAELFNFITSHRVYPEVGICRTVSYTNVLLERRVFEPLVSCFRVLEYGRIRFQPNPFYINIMQTPIKSINDGKLGMEQILTYLDGYRGSLEVAVSLAMSNIGMLGFAPDNRLLILDIINDFAMERISTASRIAQHQGDFIMASEYLKRQLLWAKTDPERERIRNLETVVALGAALQSVGNIFDATVGIKHLVLCEITDSNWQTTLHKILPRVPTVARSLSTALDAVDRYDCLYLTDQDAVRSAILTSGIEAGKVLVLSELVRMFGVTT